LFGKKEQLFSHLIMVMKKVGVFFFSNVSPLFRAATAYLPTSALQTFLKNE